jgi:hypothetical protein
LACSGRQPYVLLYKRIQRILYNNTRTFPSAPASGKCTSISNTEYLTVRRSQRLNPELHTKEVIDPLNAETERQRLKRQERLQQRRQKRQQKEDSEVSDTESVTSTSAESNTGKAHQDARDQFDTYLADLKENLQLLERTSEMQYRLDVLRSIIDNYDDLASIGNTFNDDRQAHFEPKLKQYQQEVDKAKSPEPLKAAERNCNGVRGKPKVLEIYRVQDAEIPGAKMLGGKMLGAKTEATTIKGAGLASQSSK